MRKILLLIFMINTAYADSLDKLYSYLSGTFSSANQSIYNANFYDVTVRHCPVNIDGGKPNSKYLILRQAISLFLNSPYRVRLVELSQEGAKIKSKNYAPIRNIDLNQTCQEGSIPTFSVNDFTTEPKCELTLYENAGIFMGSTGVPGCVSERSGASFVSSDVEITNSYFKSLDRGWDDQGKQVWGSENGAYVFEKKPFVNIYPNLVELASMLVGESSNQAQVQNNPVDFTFVTNKICPLKLQGSSSINLLTNQTVHSNGRSIIRTSLYQLLPKASNTTFSDPKIEVYSVVDSNFDNYCNQPERWNDIQNLNLTSTPCEVNFSKKIISKSPIYLGNTSDSGCPSSFKGSVRLDINEEISSESIQVWEKWSDSNGTQVAGSKNGPYIYVRETYPDAPYIP